ncbi:unnamed protein product [Linum trigynum]|uniref:Uncharacterized protein n=1 Tax=Linum trigynum TaxID=586398 RepID=A0AAV2GMV9_9ROSI
MKALLQGVCCFPDFADWVAQLRWAETAWSRSTDAATVGRVLWVIGISMIWKEHCAIVHGERGALTPAQMVMKVKQEFSIFASIQIEFQLKVQKTLEVI